jgi:hypothetical protein
MKRSSCVDEMVAIMASSITELDESCKTAEEGAAKTVLDTFIQI